MVAKTKKVQGTKQTFEEEACRVHTKPIKCLNERQKELVKSIEEHEITICNGLAGSGKTYMALWKALKMLEKREVERIVLVKSVTTIEDENLGFLPGDIDEKMSPFLVSFYGNIDKLIGEKDRIRLCEQKKIMVQPLCYIRGINIDNSIVLLDEAQNITIPIFKSIITRIGTNSKYVIMGDVEQIDMKKKSQSALGKIIDLFADDELIGVVKFTDEDCVRNPIIPHLLDKIKELEIQLDSSMCYNQKKNGKKQKYVDSSTLDVSIAPSDLDIDSSTLN